MSKAVVIDSSSSSGEDPWSSSDEREVDEMVRQQSIIESSARFKGAGPSSETTDQSAERNRPAGPSKRSSSGEDPWSSSDEREVDEMIRQQSIIESSARFKGDGPSSETTDQSSERNRPAGPSKKSSSGEDPWSSNDEREVDEMIRQQSIIESSARFKEAGPSSDTTDQSAERNRPPLPSKRVADIESIKIRNYVSPTKGVSFFTKNPESVLTEGDLATVRSKYGIPASVVIRLPYQGERADTQNNNWFCAYTKWFELGLRLPIPKLMTEIVGHFHISMTQLMPNGVRLLIALMVLIEEAGIAFDIFDFLRCYYLKPNSKNLGRFYFVCRQSKQLVSEFVNSDRQWEEQYFFMSLNGDTIERTARRPFPFAFGHIDFELNHPPPIGKRFQARLNALLALKGRTWAKISQPDRLRRSSIFNRFKEIPTGISIRFPKRVDRAVVPRGAPQLQYHQSKYITPPSDTHPAEATLPAMKVILPSVEEMRKRRHAEEVAKKMSRHTGESSQKETALSDTSSDHPPPLFDIQPPPPKKSKGAGTSTSNSEEELSVPQKALDVPIDVSIMQDKEAARRAAVNFYFEKDEVLLDGKPFAWLFNESAAILGQGLLLHNIFAKKAAQKYEQEVLRCKNLEEELKKMRTERERKQKEFDDMADALNMSNEKVINLSSSLRLSEERVDSLRSTLTGREGDIEDIKEQLLEVHGTSSFKARLEAMLEFKSGKLSVGTIDDEIKDLQELLSTDSSHVCGESLNEDIPIEPLPHLPETATILTGDGTEPPTLEPI